MKRRKRNEDTPSVNCWRPTDIAGEGSLITERELRMWMDWLETDQAVSAGQLLLGELFTSELAPHREK